MRWREKMEGPPPPLLPGPSSPPLPSVPGPNCVGSCPETRQASGEGQAGAEPAPPSPTPPHGPATQHVSERMSS